MNLQSELYKAVVSFWEDSLEDDTLKVPHLNVITILKKICNHPKLIKIGKLSNENSSMSIFEVSVTTKHRIITRSYLKAKNTKCAQRPEVDFIENVSSLLVKLYRLNLNG